jgi:hypothetical protein
MQIEANGESSNGNDDDNWYPNANTIGDIGVSQCHMNDRS